MHIALTRGRLVVAAGQVQTDGDGTLRLILAQYSPARVRQWLTVYGEPDDSLYGLAFEKGLIVDGSGDIYLATARFRGVVKLYDLALVKFDSHGRCQWTRTYDNPDTLTDEPHGMAADSSGNIYVLGNSEDGRSTWGRYLTASYDSTGSFRWAARYSGTGRHLNWAGGIATDPFGNIYATGGSVDTNTYWDFATVSHDSLGRERWVRRYNDPDTMIDVAKAIAVDGGGNVYVTGTTQPGTYQDWYVTIKYDSAGNEQWIARYQGQQGNSTVPTAIALDSACGVYVTGASFNRSFDIVTVKYDSAGSEQWVAMYDGPAHGNDVPWGIVLDRGGCVYVTGRALASPTRTDIVTTKYRQTSGIMIPAPGSCQRRLLRIRPNPFRGRATVSYDLPDPGKVILRICNSDGQTQEVLAAGLQRAGRHTCSWTVRPDNPAGIYSLHLETASGPETRKVVLTPDVTAGGSVQRTPGLRR